jgi:outer membrane protein assembly factor BamB
MRSRLRKLRWPAWLGIALAALILTLGGAALILRSSQPGDVVNNDVPFVASPTTSAPVATPAPQGRKPPQFDWPFYGYDKGRTHYLPLGQNLRPPFAERWKLPGAILLEFPPAIGGDSLFLLKNNGALYALSHKTGKVRWKRKLGDLAASEPAYADGIVYVVLLERGKGVKAGRVVAIRAKDGTTKWSRPLPSRAESSPIVHQGTVAFGSEDGTVYGLRASDGFTRWRYKADGAVKGGLALDGDKYFFGDYAGKMYAIRAQTGKPVWVSSTSGGRFGLGSGTFYSTAAAAYGRVYIGNTDGFVYSFSARDGKLAWRTKTGGYVYSSPAVAQVPGSRPTVYIGSYDERFYALDARTGQVRWSRPAGGRISGGATVLGDLVFFSTLNGTTSAVGARTGQTVWKTQRGKFNPIVSNGRGLFLVGQTTLYGLDGRPPRRQPKQTPSSRKLADAQAAASRQRAASRRQAAAQRARARAVAQRVGRRRAQVSRRNRLRASGAIFCFQAGGKQMCHRPAPLVCFANGQGLSCRARRK